MFVLLGRRPQGETCRSGGRACNQERRCQQADRRGRCRAGEGVEGEGVCQRRAEESRRHRRGCRTKTEGVLH